MNYYPHHIGDFNNATRHLTRLERSIYRDLLDLYYESEGPLPDCFDKLARRIIATSPEEREALQVVLEEFFEHQDDGYHNKRADMEIAIYQGRANTARENGKKGGRPRKEPTETQPVSCGMPDETIEKTNQNHNQNQNHISIPDGIDNATSPSEAAAPPSRGQRSSLTVKAMLDTCPGLTEKVAADFLTHRKSVRAALTATAWTAIVKEIQLSGWTPDNALAEAMSAGWRSLKSDWLKNRNAGDQHAARSPAPQRRLSPVERVRIANGMHPDTGEFLDDIPGTARRVG